MPANTKRRLTQRTTVDPLWVLFPGSCLTAGDVETVAAHLARGRVVLRLDLARVEYLNAATLGALVVLSQRVRAARGELSIENVEPLVYELFQVTGLARVLNVRPRSTQAITRAAV